MSALGMHILADYWHCEHLDAAAWRELIGDAVDAAGATLVEFRCREFQPQGFTALALLSESHLAVHTWPEQSYVAIDLFTCGGDVYCQAALAVLEARLQPAAKDVRRVQRGRLPVAASPIAGAGSRGGEP